MDFYGNFFKFCRGAVRLVTPKCKKVDGDYPEDPVVYITHHRDNRGVLFTLAWMTKCVHVWALDAFCDREKAFNQMYGYTYTQRAGLPKPIAFVAAKFASWGFSKMLNSSGAIPVYRGSMKIRETFTKTIKAMEEGESIVILPDVDYTSDNEEVGELYTGFLTIERLYFKRTGKHVRFVPIYACDKNRTFYIGDVVSFSDGEDFNEGKERVAQGIRDGVNALVKKSEK